MVSTSLVFDHAGIQSLEVLTAVTEQILGPQTMAVRELQKLVDDPSFPTYWHASSAFNSLSGGVRNRIAAKATALARQYYNPSADMRTQFPDLFRGRSLPTTGRAWQ